jgi:tRNA threonylcarbamoyladenosine biosynthesis protein TsaB
VTTIGFDTATAATAVAAIRDGESVFSAVQGADTGGRPRHATLLLPLVEEAAEACGGWSAIDRIAAGIGPGTFTGIRIGIVTARALAVAHGCELAGVETTHAVAARAARATGSEACAVLDAKRGEVFAARAAPDGRPVWGPLVTAPEELRRRLDDEGFEGPLAGDGVEMHSDALIAGSARYRTEGGLDVVDPAEVCRIGSDARPVEATALMPLYLRAPDAERWIARDG